MLSVPELRTTMHTGKYHLSEYTPLKVPDPVLIDFLIRSPYTLYHVYHVCFVYTDSESYIYHYMYTRFTAVTSTTQQDQQEQKGKSYIKSNALTGDFNFLSKMAISQIIEYILLRIQLSDVNPKEDARYPCENAHNAIIPHEQGVSRKTDKRLAEGGAKGGHEQKDGHDEGFHVSGRFSKGVFESGDGGEDFAECDEDVSGASVRI